MFFFGIFLSGHGIMNSFSFWLIFVFEFFYFFIFI